MCWLHCGAVARLKLGELSQSNQRLELSSTRLDETQRRLDSRLGVISKFSFSFYFLRSEWWWLCSRYALLCEAENICIFIAFLLVLFAFGPLRSRLVLPVLIAFISGTWIPAQRTTLWLCETTVSFFFKIFSYKKKVMSHLFFCVALSNLFQSHPQRSVIASNQCDNII